MATLAAYEAAHFVQVALRVLLAATTLKPGVRCSVLSRMRKHIQFVRNKQMAAYATKAARRQHAIIMLLTCYMI
jgi:hypothetical protein